MSDPYVGEIRAFSFPFAPKNWALCQGQLLPIQGNQALFSLLGTTFGGDGVRTFGLPDLRGRVPMHPGASLSQGAAGGVENVTLSTSQIPAHLHQVMVSTRAAGTTDDFSDSCIGTADANGTPANVFSPAGAGPLVPLAPDMVGPTGDGQPHSNLQPSLVINYCIALSGLFPPHS
jgi:microcystin-dependent protein